MKITLTNKTQYRDEDLRAIVHGACKAAGVCLKVLKLTVVTSRHGYVSGYAYFPRGPRGFTTTLSMRLRIPKADRMVVERVAQVALHEAMHLAGARHKDMTEEQYHCRMAVPWVEGLQLRVREDDAAPDPVLRRAAARAGRLEHAQAMLAKATTRSKRANTIEKKWKRRVALLSK